MTRDKAGQLGTCEDDLDTAEVDSIDRPDYAPDTRDWHGYFTLDRILGHVITASLGAIVALAVMGFSGWCR